MKRLAVTALLVLLSCTSQLSEKSPVTAPVEEAPAEVSTIVIPIRTTLAPLLPEIEKQVPKAVASKGYEGIPREPYVVRYRVDRDPIALNMIGNGIHATTTVRYSIEGCRVTRKPFSDETTLFPCLSCGFGEPPRDAFISLDAHLGWDDAWRLKTTTTVRPVEFTNRCTVTFAKIDISDWKIAPVVNAQLQQVAKTIDANTPKLTSIRPAAQEIWSSLQTPTEVAPRTWLVMEPLDLTLAPISGAGLNVASALSLRTRTRLVIGARPTVAPKPLPPLRVAQPASNDVRVAFDVELPWEEVSRLLSETFAGKSYQNIRVESLKVAPGEDGKVRIEAQIDYRGSGLKKYHGLVNLEGMPRFDAATSAVVIDSLDYALDSHRHNPFLRIGDRLAHDTLRQRLAQSARWSVAPQLNDVKQEIERATSRQLAAGITMHGRVASIAPESVMLRSEGVVIRVVATGEASVDVSAWKAR